jgi:putative transferase (TIGR04331 family)
MTKDSALTKINIRATSLKEFWGDKYSDSIYLWHEAKNDMVLNEIIDNKINTYIDLFATKNDMNDASKYCQKYYYKVLPILAARLNEFHNVKLSNEFWEISFGIWLYRQISVAYGKYSVLTNMDIDSVDINLLDEECFYIPVDHLDYLSCFSTDFGVQQLVSQYFYLYQNQQKSIIKYSFRGKINTTIASLKPFPPKKALNYFKGILKKSIRTIIRGTKKKPIIVLLGVYYAKSILHTLFNKSNNRISQIHLPRISLTNTIVDIEKRTNIFKVKQEKSFDNYFFNTLNYCMPKLFIENFNDYYKPFVRDLKKRTFSFIVSENWISNIPNAIYIGLAKENGKSFINNEHGASLAVLANTYTFIGYKVGDINLTNHLTTKNNQFTIGYSCRDISRYTFNEDYQKILFITRTKFLYMTEIVQYNAVNSTFIKELKQTNDFIYNLPIDIKKHLIFRPRAVAGLDFFWDVKKVLETEKHQVNIDKEDYVSSILCSKIVIIDHITTSIGELLHMDVPFIILYDIDFLPLSPEIKVIFDDLVKFGVVHTTADSAIKQVELIYNDVEKWWNSEPVKKTIKELKLTCYAPSKATEFFFSLLTKY